MSEKNVKLDGKTKITVAKPAVADKTKGLVAQLEYLRSVIKEICRALTANRERDILELIELVNSGSPAKGGNGRVKSAKLKKAEVLLSRLSVKPEKGRRSDLKRIQKNLEGIREIFGKGRNE